MGREEYDNEVEYDQKGEYQETEWERHQRMYAETEIEGSFVEWLVVPIALLGIWSATSWTYGFVNATWFSGSTCKKVTEKEIVTVPTKLSGCVVAGWLK